MLSKMKVAAGEANPLRLDAGLWLRQQRELAGLSQRELSSLLQLDYYTFISQLEHGRGKIPASRYREWASALAVDEKIFARQMLRYYEPSTYEILFGADAA